MTARLVRLGAASALVALALAISLLGVRRAAVAQPAPLVERGRVVYQQECETCHEPDGAGQPQQGIPSLHAVGGAAVDFYVSTGRMPEATLLRQAPRERPSIGPVDRAALVAYITTMWPGGPPIPTFSLEGDSVSGGVIYRGNCAACHGIVGAGAALAHGAYAPSLHRATPLQVAEAIRVGPGNMPVFDEGTLSDAQVADVVTYVQYLHHPDDPGGAGLGWVGPVAEGFVGLAIGLAVMVGIATWIGHREPSEPVGDHD
ncbi:MAG TPA: c-type cytochrome [Acidimicrobiales bacterium]|nr:c-type cytochrome [Acidimicrobiales bacterium]